jgi:hypothetical protein
VERREEREEGVREERYREDRLRNGGRDGTGLQTSG